METNFNTADYEKAMHQMYIDYAILAKKENKTDEEWLTLSDLRHSLAKDGWFEVEKRRKENAKKPWVITPKDTDEQRARDERWAPTVAVYESFKTFIKDYPGTHSKKQTCYQILDTAKDCDEFINGVVKYSEKKQHEYRVPRQLENPSDECLCSIHNMMLMNILDNALRQFNLVYHFAEYKLVDGHIRCVLPFGKTKDAMMHDYGVTEDAVKNAFNTVYEQLTVILPDINFEDTKLHLSTCIHATYGNGNPIGNDFYFSELKTTVMDQYGNKPEHWNMDSYYFDLPVIH